jgi:phage shock protein C
MTQTPYTPQDQASPSYRPLRRSQTNRQLAGVCGGIAEYFRVDPTLIRIAFIVALVITGGAVALAYVLALVVMPDGDKPAPVWHYPTNTTPPPPGS